MAEFGIRDYLVGKGNKNEDITYNNGNVMLKGKQFMSATPKADGSTYGDANQLNQAYNNYNVNDALQTFKSNIEKPRQQFSYDPNSDQGYQSALQAAGRSAQTAGNNATVALGSRGIGNSQQAMTTANQIQQRSVADVNSNMLPQLMQQAYGRFHDQQVMDGQNNDRNLQYANVLNGLNQQGLDNQFRDSQAAEQQKQGRIDLAKWGQSMYGYGDAKMDTGEFFKQYQGAKSLPVQQFDQSKAVQDAGLTGLYNGNPTMQKAAQEYEQWLNKQQLGVSQQNANTSANSSSANILNAQARLKLEQDAAGSNSLESRYKQAQIDSLIGKNSAFPKISEKESTDNYNTILGDIGGKGVTKEQAVQLVQANKNSLSDSDYKKAMDHIQKEF